MSKRLSALLQVLAFTVALLLTRVLFLQWFSITLGDTPEQQSLISCIASFALAAVCILLFVQRPRTLEGYRRMYPLFPRIENCSPKKSMTLYALMGTISIGAAMVLCLLRFGTDSAAVCTTLTVVLAQPIFEEAIFRGYFWNLLQKNGFNTAFILIITSFLSGLWQLAYWYDVALQSASAPQNFPLLLLSRLLLGWLVGALAGLLRRKLQSVFAPLSLHILASVLLR